MWKEPADMNIEVSFYQRAVDFTVTDKKVTIIIKNDEQ